MNCKNCGYNLNPNSAFCPNCGTPVNSENTPNNLNNNTLNQNSSNISNIQNSNIQMNNSNNGVSNQTPNNLNTNNNNLNTMNSMNAVNQNTNSGENIPTNNNSNLNNNKEAKKVNFLIYVLIILGVILAIVVTYFVASKILANKNNTNDVNNSNNINNTDNGNTENNNNDSNINSSNNSSDNNANNSSNNTNTNTNNNTNNNNSNNNNNTNTNTTPNNNSSNSKNQALEYLKKLKPNNTVEEINQIIGFEGKLVDASSGKYSWEFGEKDSIRMTYYNRETGYLDVTYDKSVLRNDKVDFTRYEEIKTKRENGENITYDEFKTLVGGVEGTVANKYPTSTMYVWVNSDGAYLQGTFRNSDNLLTFLSGEI